MEHSLFVLLIFSRLKAKRALSEAKKSIKGTKYTPFHARNRNEPLDQGFLNYGSRPRMGSPKIILGSQNKLAFCALCRKTLKIPVVPRNFWKKLWLLHCNRQIRELGTKINKLELDFFLPLYLSS